MTPTAPELLAGCAAALSAVPNAEDAGLYTATRLRTVATINVLVAQECATGAAVRDLGERRVTVAARRSRGEIRRCSAPSAESIDDGDLSLAALDSANARLRRLLIRLHEAVEAAADHKLDRKILALYREMARRRELRLPGEKPAT